MASTESDTPLPAGSTVPAARKAVRRSRVTNGAALPATGDGNSMWGQRYADLIVSHIADLGGPDGGLSEAQVSLVRRCAAIEVELESMEAKLSRGEDVDLDIYGRLLGHLRRALESLGRRKAARIPGACYHPIPSRRAGVAKEPELWWSCFSSGRDCRRATMATAVSGKDQDERLIGLLRTVGVLREFNDRELHVVKSLTSLWAFDAGECILREGEPGSALYIVEDGACTLEIGGRVVKFFDRGEVFGEVAVIDRQARTATVRAIRPSRLLALEVDALVRFESAEPAAALKLHKALARQLTGYVRRTDALYERMDVLLVQDGGCAPGYDSVTAQLTRALEQIGRQVFAAREGFKSLVSGTGRDFCCLVHDQALYERLEHLPGVIHAAPLAEARGASFRTERYKEFFQVELQRAAAEHIVARGVNVVIGIGGNGTFAGTNILSKLLPGSVKCFFVPVTIDSDIQGTECIGEHTGVMIGAEKIHSYVADARTHHRVYIIEMMGAEGGYHALHSCLGAGADLAVLPSSRYEAARVVRALERHRSAVIVVAEGYKRHERCAAAFSGNAAEYFRGELLEAGLDPRRKVVCEGFSRDIRGAAPNYRDITLSQRMARRLLALLLEGRTRVMPAVRGVSEGAIDFDDIRTENSVESGLAELANRLGA